MGSLSICKRWSMLLRRRRWYVRLRPEEWIPAVSPWLECRKDAHLVECAFCSTKAECFSHRQDTPHSSADAWCMPASIVARGMPLWETACRLVTSAAARVDCNTPRRMLCSRRHSLVDVVHDESSPYHPTVCGVCVCER